MVGKTISHYKIIEKLGEGGMGEVYLAEDIELERKVAIKFPPEHLTHDKENVERFKREAKAAASLNHPNIITIHEISEIDGKIFIVMEYVDGDSLRTIIDNGVSDLNAAVDITRQICEGLSEAHKANIVHRDIKPENILIDSRGRVKILDFGLAKLKAVNKLTKERSTLGTIQYMSPEQIQGKEVDQRSDIWSLGVVMYEMLTGHLPFRGEYEASMMYSILNEIPLPAKQSNSDVSFDLDTIIEKSLQKSPENRYQDVHMIVPRLKVMKTESQQDQITSSTTDSFKPSMAILPFEDMSSEKDQEYFCDGLAEELIDALTKIKKLRVVSRTSAFSFKGKNQDIKSIGKQLRVNQLLEGSVRKAGNRIRINATLINISDGYTLWSDQYDRELDDIFTIQDEITAAIVAELKINLNLEEQAQLKKHAETNQKTYNLYLLGQYHSNKVSPEGLYKSIECFEQALAQDQEYAPVHAALAISYCYLGNYAILPSHIAFPKAKEAALRAIELENSLAEAHVALAWIKTDYEWDWDGAEKNSMLAIEANPGYARGYDFYSYLLTLTKRHSESLVKIKKAIDLDPLSVHLNLRFGMVLFSAGYLNEAQNQFLKTLEMDQYYTYCYLMLGWLYMTKGRWQDAINTVNQGLKIYYHPLFLALVGTAFALSGKKRKAQSILGELTDTSKHPTPSWIAQFLILIGLDDTNEAFDALSKAYKARESGLTWMIAANPFTIELLKNDQRYKKLLKDMGLNS